MLLRKSSAAGTNPSREQRKGNRWTNKEPQAGRRGLFMRIVLKILESGEGGNSLLDVLQDVRATMAAGQKEIGKRNK